MADLYVSWSDYHEAIDRLAARVHVSGWRFNQIVCIARGGLRVGDIMSRIFRLPLAIIFTSSYTDAGGTVRGELKVSEHLAMTAHAPADRVLLVDDLVDSGVTLKNVTQYVTRRHPNVQEIRTAVLWYKACAGYRPDYYDHYLAESPWIHQPFETYDRMTVDDLRSRAA